MYWMAISIEVTLSQVHTIVVVWNSIQFVHGATANARVDENTCIMIPIIQRLI